jgi:hypothetical protein
MMKYFNTFIDKEVVVWNDDTILPLNLKSTPLANKTTLNIINLAAAKFFGIGPTVRTN